MAFYKVLKSGHFSEERFNEVGAIVEIDENAAKVAEEKGFLQITTEKPRPVKKQSSVKPKVELKPKPKAKPKKK